jgi:hypothetical protein
MEILETLNKIHVILRRKDGDKSEKGRKSRRVRKREEGNRRETS